MPLLSTVVPLVVAAVTPSPSPSPIGPPDPDKVSPGLLGLAAWVFLLVAVYVIWRSMTNQMKKISFPDPEDDQDRKRIPHRVPHAPVEGPTPIVPSRPGTAWSPSPPKSRPQQRKP